jgi:AraC family transcriptional regulator, L-rhamnose operon transcriptional activator RhaR
LDREGAVTAVLDAPALEDCLAWLTRLEALSAPDRPPERAELLGYLLLVLGRIARKVEVALVIPSSVTVPDSVLTCIRLMEDDPARAWTLTDFAQHTQLNASHFSRLFTRATGLPPMAYLCRWRLERAAALLAQTDRPVAEIGAEVGWLDANLFARRFRTHFGMSATAYRAQWVMGSILEVT